MTTRRSLLLLGSLFGFFAVALGAFGAHALKAVLPPEMLAVFETGVRYQFYHTGAILLCAVLADRMPSAATAGRFFGLGILLFSGSLYTMAVTGIRPLGMVTPFGGLCFLIGWGMLGWGAYRMERSV